MRILRLWLFERGHARKKPPVDFRQNHMHRQIGRRQTAFRLFPGVAHGCCQGQLENRYVARVQGAVAVTALAAKGRGIHDCRGFERRDLILEPRRCVWGLERRGEQSQNRKPTRLERRKNRPNRVEVSGGKICAIKTDDDEGLFLRLKTLGRDHTALRCPGAGHRQGLGPRHRPRIEARGERHLRKSRLRRHFAACVAQMRQASQRGHRQRRIRIQSRVHTPVRWQHRNRNAVALGKLLHLLKTIGPVRHPADQADKDAFRADKRLLDIGIDRQRMLERSQIRQAQTWHLAVGAAAAMPARRKRTKIAVGKREHNQIARGLTQIGWGFRFL